MNIYKIEEVAKECGLTNRTIRYYEEIVSSFGKQQHIDYDWCDECRSNRAFHLSSCWKIGRVV